MPIIHILPRVFNGELLVEGEIFLDERAIRYAWYEFEKLFGPPKYGQDVKLLESAQNTQQQ